MSHTVRFLIKAFSRTAIFIASGLLLGCSLVDIKPHSSSLSSNLSKQKVFFANYDNVWRAAHSVVKYPIAQENQDTGFLETDYIKAVDGWNAPTSQKTPSSGLRYKLHLTFAKGAANGRSSTRVTIEKKMEILRDFLSDPEPIESDGLEEKILFYRIERELIIMEALKKAN